VQAYLSWPWSTASWRYRIDGLTWCMILAAVTRLITLQWEWLWYDELFTASLARLPIANLLAATMGDVHPPLWYLLEWFITRLLGDNAFVLRLISAIAGIALVPAVAKLADRLGGEPTIAALLVATSPFTIYYSQEARPYSLLMLVCVGATIALIDREWLKFAVLSGLSLWLHNLAALYVFGLFWLAVWQERDRLTVASFMKIVAWFGLAGLIVLPWVMVGLTRQVEAISQGGFWVRPLNVGTPLYILSAMLFSEDSGWLVLVTGLLVPLILAQVITAERKWATLGLLFIPLGAAIIISVMWRPILIARIMAPAVPALLVLISRQSRETLTALLICFTVWFGIYALTDKVGRGSFAEIERIVRDNQVEGIYHVNVDSYISVGYYFDLDQAVWPQANNLSQSLSAQTKEAMGMNQAPFEQIACQKKKWLLFLGSNPTTSAAELSYMNELLEQYQPERVDRFENNPLVERRAYLVEPKCYSR